jgi:hypothetical protein
MGYKLRYLDLAKNDVKENETQGHPCRTPIPIGYLCKKPDVKLYGYRRYAAGLFCPQKVLPKNTPKSDFFQLSYSTLKHAAL